MREPEKYECRKCGFKSNEVKILRIGAKSFPKCITCNGSVWESPEWLKWNREEKSN